MINFPKSERVSFLLRQDLAERIPPENPERRRFLNRAVEHELDGISAAAARMGEKGGAKTSEAKKRSSAENGRKGGYWKNFKKPSDPDLSP